MSATTPQSFIHDNQTFIRFPLPHSPVLHARVSFLIDSFLVAIYFIQCPFHVPIIACLIIIDKLTKIKHSLPKNDGHDRCHQQKYHRAGDDEGGALKRWIRVVRSIDHLENKEDPSLDDSLFQSLPNI